MYDVQGRRAVLAVLHSAAQEHNPATSAAQVQKCVASANKRDRTDPIPPSRRNRGQRLGRVRNAAAAAFTTPIT